MKQLQHQRQKKLVIYIPDCVWYLIQFDTFLGDKTVPYQFQKENILFEKGKTLI